MKIENTSLKLHQKSTSTFAMQRTIGESTMMDWQEAQKRSRKSASRLQKVDRIKSIGQLENMRQYWPIG